MPRGKGPLWQAEPKGPGEENGREPWLPLGSAAGNGSEEWGDEELAAQPPAVPVSSTVLLFHIIGSRRKHTDVMCPVRSALDIIPQNIILKAGIMPSRRKTPQR